MGFSSLPQEITDKFRVDESSGCWLWTAAQAGGGYGVKRWEGRLQPAHRVVYSLLAGDPGPELDHLCRVRHCVNPDHLEPVTHSENLLRGGLSEGRRKRWPVGRLCPHGHVMDGDNLYVHFSERLNRTNFQCRACKSVSDRRRKAARRLAKTTADLESNTPR